VRWHGEAGDSVGVIQKTSRAGAKAGQLHRTRGRRRCRTMQRGSPAGREVLDDGDRQQDHDRDDEQARRPRAGFTVPALYQQLIHGQHRPDRSRTSASHI